RIRRCHVAAGERDTGQSGEATTAAGDAAEAVAHSLRVGAILQTVVVHAIPVRTPFGGVAMHVIEAEIVGALLADRMQFAPGILVVPADEVEIEFAVAGVEARDRSRARREFPFSFSRQADSAMQLFAQPRAEVVGLKPGDSDHGRIWVWDQILRRPIARRR